jgi:hypothetical protein
MAKATVSIDATFKPYVEALGRVAHAWNILQETLGELFWIVTGLDKSVAFAIWYSTTSDRTQREMLRAAILAKWALKEHQPPHTEADMIWLLDKVDGVADRRNVAVHAPCAVSVNFETRTFGISPRFFHGHPLAGRLVGKDIVDEFAWYEVLAAELREYAREMVAALQRDNAPWPQRPQLPTPGQTTSRKGSDPTTSAK